MFPTAPKPISWACACLSSISLAAAQSGSPLPGLKYGDNWAPTTLDSDIVTQNFPDVDIPLLSPAFLNPESVPAGFSNGTAGPTDDIELGESSLGRGDLGYHTDHASRFLHPLPRPQERLDVV